MIDGMDNNERFIGTIGVRPSIDAIQEFKVRTNLHSADVTRTSAGVVNILTKSGTNEIHGTLFEFFRNDKLDANQNYNFTGSASGQLPKGEFRQNQFGGSVGGAIKKDKTFFFGDYEKLSIRQAIPISAVVPTDCNALAISLRIALPVSMRAEFAPRLPSSLLSPIPSMASWREC